MTTLRVVAAPARGFTTAKQDLRKRTRHSVAAQGLKSLQQSYLSHYLLAKTNRNEPRKSSPLLRSWQENQPSTVHGDSLLLSSLIPSLPASSTTKIQSLKHQSQLARVQLNVPISRTW